MPHHLSSDRLTVAPGQACAEAPHPTDAHDDGPHGTASCPGMSHPGVLPAPGVAGWAEAAATGRAASAALGPGVPSGTYDRVTTAPAASPTSDASTTPVTTVAEAVTHHRRRLAVPRSHRVNPCFSDDEWTEITAAAHACQLTPGGFTAAATVAYSRTGRRTGIDDERRRLEDLMNANSALGATGGRLNHLAHQLNSGDTPSARSAALLQGVALAVNHVDAAVSAVPRTEPKRPHRAPAAEITLQHRRRMCEPRRNRTHPCFSDSEWAALTTAAGTCNLKPGGYAAAAALLAARRSDPRAAIADTRRQLEELMESNRQLAAVGNNLNQILLHLHPANSLHALAQSTLRLTRAALDDVDAAATEIAWK